MNVGPHGNQQSCPSRIRLCFGGLSRDPDRDIGWRSAQPSESCLEETSAVGIGATKHFNAVGSNGYQIDVSIAVPPIEGAVFTPRRKGC
jgi:hypothetical protein